MSEKNYTEIVRGLSSPSFKIMKTDLILPEVSVQIWSSQGFPFHKKFDIYKQDGAFSFVFWSITNAVGEWESLMDEYYYFNFHKLEERKKIQITPLMKIVWLLRGDLQEEFSLENESSIFSFWRWWITESVKYVRLFQPLPLQIILNFEDQLLKSFLKEVIWKVRGDLQSKLPEDLEDFDDKLLEWWKIDGIKEYFSILKHDQKYFTSEKLSDYLGEDFPLFIKYFIYEQRIDLKEFFNSNFFDIEELIQWWNNYGSFEHFKNEYCTILTKENNSKKKIALFGHFTGILGIGEDIRIIAEALSERGYFIDYYSLGFDYKEQNFEFNGVKSWQEYLAIYDANIFCMPAFDLLTYFNKVGVEIFTTTLNIGIFQWELEYFPVESKFALDLMHKVCSISTFASKSISLTYKKNVNTLNLPFLNLPLISEYNREYFKLPEESFLFFFAFDLNSFITRKNPLGTIEAFQRTFKKYEDVKLVIKSMGNCTDTIWNECKRRALTDNRIILIDEVFTKNELNGLLNCMNTVVSLHRAEGFGRLMGEALLLEIPIIASNYSGNLDYLNNENSYLVDGKLVPIYENEYLFWRNQVWFEPDLNQASLKIKEVFENYFNAKEKAKKGKKLFLEQYSKEKISEQLGLIIERI